jgi:hypothetical protein
MVVDAGAAGPRGDDLPHTEGVAVRAATAPTAGAVRRRVARKRRGDLLVILTATRAPDESPAPRATVRIRALRRHLGVWRPLGRRVVGHRDGFFWYPLTGRHAIRGFRVNPDTGAIRFRVLLTPALGYSKRYRFTAADDHLSRA